MMGVLPAAAQDATWLPPPGVTPADFNNPNNWNPVGVPTGTAFFGAANITDLTFSADTSIDGFTFNAGAAAFAFSNPQVLTFDGAGIIINGAGATHTAILSNDAGGTTNFNGSSSLDRARISNNDGTTNFNGSSSAGIAFAPGVAGATIDNHADLNFNDNSTAGGARITNNNFATTNFNGNSSAGNADIRNRPFDGLVSFNDNSTAGSATITNNGDLRFFDNSTADRAEITNFHNLEFFKDSTAGNADIINDSSLYFFNNSTAGGATIFNDSVIRFNDDSTAGTAEITTVRLTKIIFLLDSSAGSAKITNVWGTVDFSGSSTAGSAEITNNHSGTVNFRGSSTASSAKITNNWGTVDFSGSSTADSATITNNDRLRFFENSTAGQAQIVTNAGAVTDFSASTGPLGNNQLTAGSFAGAGLYFLGANALTVGGNGLSTEVSGVISDCGPSGTDCQVSGATGGSLVKTGTGILNLTGINIYTGATTVNVGTLLVNGSIVSSSGLTVNPGGTVGGTGTLPTTTINGGMLSPGNSIGTITTAGPGGVSGNLLLNSAATYLVEVSPTAADFTDVTGTATLGGTVQLVFLPGTYVPRTYPILSAAGGLIGTFDALSPLFAGSLTYNYTTNDVLLNLVLGLGRVNGLTRNQQAVGSAIDNAFNSGVPLGGRFVNLLNLTPATLPAALDQLSGEISTSTQSAAFRSMDFFLQMMLDPFVAERSNFAGGPALAFSGEGPPRSALAPKFPIKEPPPPSTFEQRWTAWGGAYGGRESRDGDVSIGSHETRTNVWGLAAGADWRLQDSVLGVALSAGTTSFDLAEGLGSGDTEFMQVGLYGSTRIGAAYASAALAYGWHQAEHARTIAFAGPDTLKGEFDAHQFGGRIEAGWRQATPWLAVTPYAAMTAQQFHSPGYSETATAGVADFALDYAGDTSQSVRSELGAWLDQVYAYGYGGVLKLRGRAAWVHDYSDDPVMDAAFPVLPGSDFGVTGAAAARDALLASAASELQLASGLSFIARFDGEFARTAQAFSGTATLRRVW